jgi:hypothetical protein
MLARVTSPASAWKRRLLLAGVVLLGLLALAQWVVPRLLVAQLADAAASVLGRRVAIGGLDLTWLPLRVVVRELEVGGALDAEGAAGGAPLRFERLALESRWRSLLRRELHVTLIELDAPALRLERDAEGALVPLVLAESSVEPAQDAPAPTVAWPIHLARVEVRGLTLDLLRAGDLQPELELALARLSLTDLALREGVLSVAGLRLEEPELVVQRSLTAAVQGEPGIAATAESEAPSAPAASPPAATGSGPDPLERHRLEALEVSGARLRLAGGEGEPLEGRLDLSARGVSLGRGQRFPLQARLELADGSVALEGELSLREPAFDGSLGWQGLSLPVLWAASGLEADLRLDAGRSQGQLAVALSARGPGDAPPELQLSGAVQIADLDAKRPDLRLAWSQLSLEGAALRVPLAGDAPPALALSRVSLRAPQIEYERAPPPASSLQVPLDAPVAPQPRLSLAQLSVEQGRLQFRDRAPRDPFETRWQKLSLEGRGLRWPEQDAEMLKLTAVGSGNARLEVNASFEQGRGRVETRLERVALVPLDSYTATHTGVRIDAGRGSLRSLLEVGERSLRTDSVVELHRLRLHEEDPGWFQRVFGLPLDLALALLRDLEGDIRLPIDAEFAVDDTRLGTGSLLASTLKQAILGALTSPLKLLGGSRQAVSDLLRSGLAPLEAVPGLAVLAASEQARMQRLAETLDDKPQLQVVLRGRAGPADDAGIARRRLIRQARAEGPLDGAQALSPLERRRVRDALAVLDAESPAPLDVATEPLVQRLLAAVRVNPADRLALAHERAVHARQRLVEDLQVPEEAVTVDEAALGDPAVLLELRARPDIPVDDSGG